MIKPDTMDPNECLDMAMIAVNPNEISMLATAAIEESFDNGFLEAGAQPSVVVQPVNPEMSLDLPSLTHSDDFLFDNTKLLEDDDIDGSLQPTSTLQQAHLVPKECLSPGSPPASPEYQDLQPATPEPMQQLPQQTLDTQPSSPAFLVLQPATPEPLQQQSLIVVSTPQQTLDTQPASPEFLVLQPAICEATQEADSPASVPQLILGPESTVQYLDLPQLSTSFESVAASPADSSVLSPSSLSQDLLSPSPASQQAVYTPKKRGRKRKYPEGMAPSRKRPRKTKVYEMGPLADEEQERKRKNAMNAKRHRDLQKLQKQELINELAQARTERDKLQEMVNQLQQREKQLLRTLNMHGLHHTLDGL